MNWFLTALLCVLLIELTLRLPFATAVVGASRSAGRAVRVVRAKAVSDHWKEKALATYARTTFLSSLKLAGLMAILLTVAVVLVAVFEQGSSGFQGFILGWRGIGSGVVFTGLYSAARRSIVHGRL